MKHHIPVRVEQVSKFQCDWEPCRLGEDKATLWESKLGFFVDRFIQPTQSRLQDYPWNDKWKVRPKLLLGFPLKTQGDATCFRCSSFVSFVAAAQRPWPEIPVGTFWAENCCEVTNIWWSLPQQLGCSPRPTTIVSLFDQTWLGEVQLVLSSLGERDRFYQSGCWWPWNDLRWFVSADGPTESGGISSLQCHQACSSGSCGMVPDLVYLVYADKHPEWFLRYQISYQEFGVHVCCLCPQVGQIHRQVLLQRANDRQAVETGMIPKGSGGGLAGATGCEDRLLFFGMNFCWLCGSSDGTNHLSIFESHFL